MIIMTDERTAVRIMNCMVDELDSLRRESNVLRKLHNSLDSRDQADWELLILIDSLFDEEGIEGWIRATE
tara:strand:+ start:9438 stop:9647 length:210 start_codon:yes stop_codon:yes gene_type:complete